VPVVSGGVTVVVLCTANICRSPMGEALLADRLVAVGVVATAFKVFRGCDAGSSWTQPGLGPNQRRWAVSRK